MKFTSSAIISQPLILNRVPARKAYFTMQHPPEVFISYSSKDNKYKDDLLNQLKVLTQQQVISAWHDGLLVPGQQWNNKIVEHLNSSRVILLLISSDFLASDYVNNVELKMAATRHEKKEACVIPVLVRNVNSWQGYPFGDLKLGDLQAVPLGAKFIVDWDNRDKAFAEVASGIQRAVEQLKTDSETRLNPLLPPPPIVDFVARKGRDGNYIVERLKEELVKANKRLVVLSGQGGVGKTTIAAEVARSLIDAFSGRIVWASAEKRAGFTFSTLLDEIATQLGDNSSLTLTIDRKEKVVCTLVAEAPALIVLDNFETVPPSDQAACAKFLRERVPCPSLITSRQQIPSIPNIPIDGMSPEEAREFLVKLIAQMQDPLIFLDPIRQQIIRTAEARPYVMEWVVAQIDQRAEEPSTVLKELSQGVGDAAERIFNHSFNLPQVGDDGRAVLLALSLFVPGASRGALAEVAGFGDKQSRLSDAVKHLRALLLVKGIDENRRLRVEGLTRSLAKARLAKDKKAAELRKRFVAYFLKYAEAHGEPTAADYNALESEKDNLLGAIDVAFEVNAWDSVQGLAEVLASPSRGMLAVHGYWDEAIRRGEQALEVARKTGNQWAVAQFAGNAAAIRLRRGEYADARHTYQQALEAFKNLGADQNIAACLHNLAFIAHNHGDLEEARRLYHESLEIEKRLGNQLGIADTLHQLATLFEGQGDLEEARRLYNESLAINTELGDQSAMSDNLHQLGILAQDNGEFDEARRLYTEALEIKRNLGDQKAIASALHELGRLAQAEGDAVEAQQLYDQSLEINTKLGDQSSIASTLHQLAVLAQNRGELEEAHRLYSESLVIKKKVGNQSGIAIALHELGRLAQNQGDLKKAGQLYGESLEIKKKLGNQRGIAATLHQLGTLAEAEGTFLEAAELFGEALAILEKLKSPKAQVVRQSLERVQGKSS